MVTGGVFHDCLVHDFDMACWVLGELPIRVQASATALIPEIKAIDDFDTIGFMLTYPSGTIVLGDNSRFSPNGYDQRLEVFGNKGKEILKHVILFFPYYQFIMPIAIRCVLKHLIVYISRHDQGGKWKTIPLDWHFDRPGRRQALPHLLLIPVAL